MAKVMLEKYIHWYSQLKNNTLKGTGIPSSTPTLLVREYQDKKHEVSSLMGQSLLAPERVLFLYGKEI